MISTEFDFVEPDKKENTAKKKFVINPQDMETVKQQLTEVWDKIQTRIFIPAAEKQIAIGAIL